MNIRPDTWMPMFWGDYARDTAHLDATMHGAYLMLIKHYWCTGGPLPDDDGQLWRVACCNSLPAWKKIRPIIERFFTVADGMWTHKRIDAELARAQRNIDQRSNAGKASAKARSQRPFNGRSTDVATPVATEGEREGRTSPSPSLINSPSESDAAEYVWKGTHGRRLTRQNWEQWRRAYRNLAEPDLRRELMKADAYYAEPDKKWFFRFSTWLATADKDAGAGREPEPRIPASRRTMN